MTCPSGNFAIPIRTHSNANKREFWRKKADRVKREREAARLSWFAAGKPTPTLPAVVTLTRVASRDLDADNLAGAFKAVQDGLAQCWEIDDGDPRIRWVYRQRRGKYAVEVEWLPRREWAEREIERLKGDL